MILTLGGVVYLTSGMLLYSQKSLAVEEIQRNADDCVVIAVAGNEGMSDCDFEQRANLKYSNGFLKYRVVFFYIECVFPRNIAKEKWLQISYDFIKSVSYLLHTYIFMF